MIRKKVLIGSFITLLALAVVLLGVMLTYKFVKTQGVIESYIVNSEKNSKKVLIATQKSNFKNSVMQNVTAYYSGQPIFLSVIDVTQLAKVKGDLWDKIIIFSTIESNKINPAAEKFVKDERDHTKIFVFNTADSGMWKNNTIGIDCITSASKKTNVDKYTSDIINAIDKLK